MLYLLHPLKPMRVCIWEVAHGPIHDEARLVTLPWQLTTEESDSVLVRLALRHGTSCPDGIVIHHEFVAMRNGTSRWDHLASVTQLPIPAPPSSLGRDYAVAVRRFDEQLARSERSMRRMVQHRLDRALTPPPVPQLVRHWSRLVDD